jgi:hypothetical protein
VTDFVAKHGAQLSERLDAGERLNGVVAANQQLSTFAGHAVAIGVTDRRLLIQPLDRRGEAKGEAISITPAELVSADGGPAGGDWMTLGSIVLDHAGVRLTLRTADGQKVRLMLMSGSGVFGKLGGGESQRAGAEALGRWLADAGDAAGS